jgi:hypothetical protein
MAQGKQTMKTFDGAQARDETILVARVLLVVLFASTSQFETMLRRCEGV